MKKFFLLLLMVLLVAFSVSGIVGAETANIYNEVIQIMDWGPATTKVIVDMGKEINAQAIAKDAFTVQVQRIDNRTEEKILEEGERTITEAYVSDETGNRANSGRYITLELSYSIQESLSSPMNYFEGSNVWLECPYTITQAKEIDGISGIVANTLGTTYKPDLDHFDVTGSIDFKDSEFGDITMSYASYKPQGAYEGENIPLIIWLHGGGEGGTDSSVPLSANKACAFASKEVQAYFGGSAYVLVPQSPTFWMDIGTGASSKEVHTSMYTNALFHLFDAFVAENPAIDPNRIYIGGCSNGGYMTVSAILDRPDYFAAAYPVCEAVQNATISDEELANIIDLPIFFVHAAADEIVPAPVTTLSTYDRLVKAGAENVHLYYPKYVKDLYQYNGENFSYNGHWSWIYLYNNDVYTEIDGESISFMEWLGAQSK